MTCKQNVWKPGLGQIEHSTPEHRGQDMFVAFLNGGGGMALSNLSGYAVQALREHDMWTRVLFLESKDAQKSSVPVMINNLYLSLRIILLLQ
jgi:hypothetical protein